VDDRDTFDRKCVELHMAVYFHMQAIQFADERNAEPGEMRELLKRRTDLVQEALDYVYEHWEYLDEPTKKDWEAAAAEFPLARENENSEATDED